jgi:hypothetical protein
MTRRLVMRNVFGNDGGCGCVRSTFRGKTIIVINLTVH